MKKILVFLAIVGSIVFTSCEGPEGPEGPPGPPGMNGQNDEIGVVYENTSANYYNFTTGNNFKVRFNFPGEGIYDSDVVLVYRLGGVDNGKAIWEFLPETYYFDDGRRDFSFNFNFTYNYVDIYLNGNDLATVPTNFRTQQIFRIVVLPADYATSVNKNSFSEVMSVMKVKENEVKKIDF